MVQITTHIPENTRLLSKKDRCTNQSYKEKTSPSPGSPPRSCPSTLPERSGPSGSPVTTPCHRRAGGGFEPSGPDPGTVVDLSIALDLRRPQPQPVVEAILTLSHHVAPGDRRLIEAVYKDGHTLHALSELIGERPRSLRRRYRRVISRLIEPRFAFVASRGRLWPARRRLVGTLHIIRGRTIRDTARRLGLTEHAVRRELSVIDGLFEEYAANTATLFESHPDSRRHFRIES